MSEYPIWYAVHTEAQNEALANLNLRRQGYWTFFPVERVRRRRKLPNRPAFRIEWVERAYYPRYLFVALRYPHESIYAVNNTVGVSTVVYCGQEPLPIPNDVMDEVMARADGAGLMDTVDRLARKRFDAGQMVRFEDNSPLRGLLAEVSVDKGNAVMVWVRELSEKPVRVSPELIAAI